MLVKIFYQLSNLKKRGIVGITHLRNVDMVLKPLVMFYEAVGVRRIFGNWFIFLGLTATLFSWNLWTCYGF